MKILFYLVVALLVSCTHKPFTGYLVCKEFIPKHMSNEDEKPIIYAAVPFRPVIIPQHKKPKLVEDQFNWYVDNKYSVNRFTVSRKKFHSKRLGDKITIK